MAIPKDVQIPKSEGQFAKLEEGKNKFRVLSDIIRGWEGWKNNKPFRHEGDVCKIKPEQVDTNKYGNPNINYFWAMVVWNFNEERIQVLQITQKSIMTPMYDLEQQEEWGDLKNYDIVINRTKEGDKTKYSVNPLPHKELSADIRQAYEETKITLEKIFEGEYPIEEDINLEDTSF